jgi:hypothetical protein
LTLVFAALLASPILCVAQQPSAASVDPKVEAKAREWLYRLQTGDIDRNQLNALVAKQFTPEIVRQVAQQLGPLGDPTGFVYVSQQTVRDTTVYQFLVTFKSAKLNEFLDVDQAGRIGGITVKPYSDPNAMQKLTFLTGAWSCTIKGATPKDLRQDAHYSFSPDGHWLTEVSHDIGPGDRDWMTQIWGYDALQQKLVAYQFYQDGVSTKTVNGWDDGVFVSHRDDNGATVSLKPVDANTIQWIIESADHSSIVTEDCARSKE